MPCELDEVLKLLVEQAVQTDDVDLEIPMDKEIAKAGDTPKTGGELWRHDAHVADGVDSRRIVRHVTPRRRRQVRGDVECVLGAKLQASFHNLALFKIRVQLLEWATFMVREDVQRGVEGSQVSPHQLGVDSARAHRPKAPTARRAR